MHTHTHTSSSSSSVLLVLKDVGQDLGRHVTVIFQQLVDERSPPCVVLYHCLSVRQACQVLVDYIDPSQWCSSRWSTHSSWSALDDLTLQTMNRHSQQATVIASVLAGLSQLSLHTLPKHQHSVFCPIE